MWGNQTCTMKPERLTCEEFEALRELKHEGHGQPYNRYRMLIDGRWHIVSRQFSFGAQVFYRHPVILVVPGISA